MLAFPRTPLTVLWLRMWTLAFAPCQPGETPTEASLTALIKVGSTDPPLGSIAAIRHLVFEAQTILVSQTKALIENKEHEVKELAPAERRERVRAQARRLAGITMAGQSECSYASYDLCMKLLTDNCVSYLPPSKFVTREAELRSDKPRKELDVQSSTIVLKDRDPDQSCDTSTALSLHHALHRRSLALDLIGVTDYFKVQGFADLMGHLHQEPMAGSRATTVQQILHADRAAWVRLAELTLTASAGMRRVPCHWTAYGPVSKQTPRSFSICCPARVGRRSARPSLQVTRKRHPRLLRSLARALAKARRRL